MDIHLSQKEVDDILKKSDSFPCGWSTKDERLLLIKYAQLSSASILEIGTAFGSSAAIFILASQQSIISIDPYNYDTYQGYVITPQICQRYIHEIVGETGRWTLITSTSHDVSGWCKLGLGLVYIDKDDVEYEEAKQDFEDWIYHIVPSGYFIMHNSRKLDDLDDGRFRRGYVGPTKLAKELLVDNRVKLVDEEFSLTVWEKK